MCIWTCTCCSECLGAPKKAAYVRSLSAFQLQDFQLTALNRIANARRDFQGSRAELEEQREILRFVAQVLKERKIGIFWSSLLPLRLFL
jgi:hypothetical protein